jgi:hypothetical protein
MSNKKPFYQVSSSPEELQRVLDEAKAAGEKPLVVTQEDARTAEGLIRNLPVECLIALLVNGPESDPAKILLLKVLIIKAIWDKTAPPEARVASRPAPPMSNN